MAKRLWLRWNTMASILALVMAGSFALQLQSSWKSSTPLAQENPSAVSEPASPARPETASSERAKTEGHGQQEEEGTLGIIFHWFNFVLILGGIGYLGKKYIAPFFDQRARAIQQEMEHSAQMMAEATQRLSQIEDKLERLDGEIQKLRQAALEAAAAERTRIEETAKADAEKIVRTAEQEIAAAAKAARRELRIYTANLAVGFAEKRIRETITPQAEKRIFHSFLENLQGDSRRRSANLAPPGTAPPDNDSSARGGA